VDSAEGIVNQAARDRLEVLSRQWQEISGRLETLLGPRVDALNDQVRTSGFDLLRGF